MFRTELFVVILGSVEEPRQEGCSSWRSFWRSPEPLKWMVPSDVNVKVYHKPVREIGVINHDYSYNYLQ